MQVNSMDEMSEGDTAPVFTKIPKKKGNLLTKFPTVFYILTQSSLYI